MRLLGNYIGVILGLLAMNVNKEKLADLLAVICLVSIGFSYSLWAKDLFIGKSVFFALASMLPSILYLSLRKIKDWKKIFISVILFGLFFQSLFDFFQIANNSYILTSTIAPLLFGIMPLDIFVWDVLMVTFTLIFYQHFFKDKTDYKVSPRIKYFIPALILVLILVLLYKPIFSFFINSYAYLGLFAIIPALILVIRRSWLVRNTIYASSFFFFFYLGIELIGLHNQQWIFPGNYIAKISLIGYRFPLEELFFWMIFYVPSLIGCYELFIEPKHK